MSHRTVLLILLTLTMVCAVALPCAFAISSEPVYNEAGEQTQQQAGSDQQSGNPLAISSEPVYKGGPAVQNGPVTSGNPLAISSEPVYRGGGNPAGISNEPTYRGGGAPQINQNAARKRNQTGR